MTQDEFMRQVNYALALRGFRLSGEPETKSDCYRVEALQSLTFLGLGLSLEVSRRTYGPTKDTGQWIVYVSYGGLRGEGIGNSFQSLSEVIDQALDSLRFSARIVETRVAQARGHF